MAKQVKTVIKIQATAGKATPAPPIGPALGSTGINIGQFVKEFNDATASMGDLVIPAVITVYDDRSFTFVLKTPPTAELLKKVAKISKGSGIPNKNKVAKITQDQLKEVAEKKLEDLNTTNIDAAVKIIAGTARNMGIEIAE